jgi:hypothetical protein
LAGILAQTTRVDQDDGLMAAVFCAPRKRFEPGELTVVPHASPQGKRPSL